MTKSELVAKFGPEVDQSDLIAQCENLMTVFSISVEELYLKWESFVYSRDENLEISMENLQALKNYIQNQIEKRPAPSGLGSTAKKPKLRFNMTPSTPSLKRVLPHATTPIAQVSTPVGSSPVTPKLAVSQTESGKVLETLNGELEFSEFAENVKLNAFFDPTKYKFRTMRQNLIETGDVLDEQIDAFTAILSEKYGFEAVGDPSRQSQSEIYCVGRIVPDSPEDETLNSASLALEVSRVAKGNGVRAKLRLDVPEYSLFPGQIVGLRGKNASGDYFQVSEILELPLLNAPLVNPEDVPANDTKVIVACGPFTSQRDLEFQLLRRIVDRIEQQKPSCVVLLGPFLDTMHPMVRNGNIEGPYKNLDEVFQALVAPILKQITCQCIVVPSTRDVVSKHAAYPQDAFEKKLLPKNFKCFTNPSTFQVSGTYFGVSNTDVFRDLKDVTTLTENRFDRIARHVLEQRRYYPVFPGKQPLDVPFLGLSEFSFIPDVLIMPSDLRYFARVVKNVVVINPGNKGTVAEISIKAGGQIEVGKEELINDWKRCKVDIVTV